jgi:tetratricopeptide (TPR) repeat protein
LQKICQICAEYAISQKQYEEAGILFSKAGDYQNAMKSYEAALNIGGFKSAAKKLGQDSSAIQRSLLVFALKFEQQGKYLEAAEVYRMLNEENNLVKIIENFIKAQEWRKALDEIQLNSEAAEFEKAETKMNQAIIDRYNSLSSELKQIRENIEKYSTRLEIVRTEKEKQVEEWLENEGEVDAAQSETMSEASTASGMSNISRLSRMSTMSAAQAKRRKNVERKKKNIKEGSQFEDIGLLTALTEIIAKLNEIQKELAQLLPILVAFDFIEEARNLQKEAHKVVKFAYDRRITIWPRYIKPKHLTGPLAEIYRCEDGIIRMPGEEHMPTRIYIENEMFPPTLETTYSWKLKSLE